MLAAQGAERIDSVRVSASWATRRNLEFPPSSRKCGVFEDPGFLFTVPL